MKEKGGCLGVSNTLIYVSHSERIIVEEPVFMRLEYGYGEIIF